MHILILPSWYPLSEESSGGSFFREQALAYKRLFPGDTVSILFCPSFRFYELRMRINIKKSDCGVITWIASFRKFPKLRRVYAKMYAKNIMLLFKDYIEEYGMPDLIHVHAAYPAAFSANLIRKKYKIPYIITEHSSAYHALSYDKKLLLSIKEVVKEAEICVAVSESFSQLLQKIFRRSYIFIPNIVNKNFFSNNLTVKLNKKRFIFLFVGALTERKGVNLLINAFSKAFPGNINVFLSIAGLGKQIKKLKLLSDRLNISNKINFLGSVSRGDLPLLMSEFDAFILPSVYEAFGVVYVEALASGLPVIATKCGGPESIVSSEVGYLVENNDEKALIEAMNDCYRKKDLWSSKKLFIRNYCESKFSERVVMSNYNQLYSEVILKNECNEKNI